MMYKMNECYNCGLDCRGICNQNEVVYKKCDKCKEETDELYNLSKLFLDETQYCEECAREIIKDFITKNFEDLIDDFVEEFLEQYSKKVEEEV